MSIYEPSRSPWTGRVLSLFRIVAGVVFITFGTMKVFNYPPLPAGQPPIPLLSQAGIGGLMEVIGGILIALGLFTRPTAFILSGEMAVAYWQFHAPNGAWPILNHGGEAVLYCFLFLYMAAHGAGPYSLDALICKKKS